MAVDIFSIFSLFDIVLLCTSVVGLFYYRKFGWVATVANSYIFASSTCINIIYMLYALYGLQFGYPDDVQYYSQETIISIGISLIFLGLVVFLIYYFNKKSVKEFFDIDKQLALNTLYGGLGVSLIMWALKYYLMGSFY